MAAPITNNIKNPVACSNSFFPDGGGGVTRYNVNILQITTITPSVADTEENNKTTKHSKKDKKSRDIDVLAVNSYGLFNNLRKPFIPICVINYDFNNYTISYNSVSSFSSASQLIHPALFIGLLNASRAYINNDITAPEQILNGVNNPFASYLGKKIGNDNNVLQKYLYVSSWLKYWLANLSGSISSVQQSLTDLEKNIGTIADPLFFIPPAQYLFNASSIVSDAIANIIAGGFNAIECIELTVQ